MIQLNFLLLFFLAVFLLRAGIQIYLNWLNISYLGQHGTTVPEFFQDIIDPEKLKKISAYTIASENFGMVAALASHGLLLAILLSGFLPWLGRTISLWKYGPIVSGLIFFAVFSIVPNLYRIPFILFET